MSEVEPFEIEAKDPQSTLVSVLQSPIWGALLLVISGMALGISFLHPDYWSLAWLGMIGTVLSLCLYTHAPWLIVGLILGGFAQHWIGFPWTFEAVYRFGGSHWDLWTTAGMWTLINLFGMLLPERLPLIIMVCIRQRHKIPLWLWFPLAWWLGEILTFHTSGLVVSAFLYSQWQFSLMLKSVGHLGWELSLVLSLAVCACLAQALAQRSGRHAAVAAAYFAVLWLLPALPNGHQALKNVAAVHMNEFAERPQEIPAGVNLLVWPEALVKGRWRIDEGPGNGVRMRLPLSSANAYHIFGRETLTSQRTRQNSLLALAPDGEVLIARAKQFLFPGGERPYFGLQLGTRDLFVPGQRSPVMDINGQRVIALLCYEEFDRYLVRQGKAEGADLISVSAMEHSVGSSPEAASQFLGIAVLIAVENGLPLVRSSFKGVAALIAPDGEILAMTQPKTSGILTLP